MKLQVSQTHRISIDRQDNNNQPDMGLQVQIQQLYLYMLKHLLVSFHPRKLRNQDLKHQDYSNHIQEIYLL